MAEVDAARQQFVGAAGAAATAVPIDPRATGDAASDNGGFVRTTIDVSLEGASVTLEPTRASVQRVVGTAYLLGGFELVVALEDQVQRRVQKETLLLAQNESFQRADRQGVRARPLYAAEYQRALATSISKGHAIRARLESASDIHELLLERWARIAEAEEEVLREFEPALLGQFAELANNARTLALKEWDRYEPYDPTEAEQRALTTTEAKGRGRGQVLLRKEADSLIREIRALHAAWAAYLDSLYSARALAASLQRPTGLTRSEKASRLAASRARSGAMFQAFDDRRSDIGKRFPVALQVYGRLVTLKRERLATPDTTELIQLWVAEALVEAVETSQDLAVDALLKPMFPAQGSVRVEPTANQTEVRTLPDYQQDLLRRGLTIPVSRIVANRLRDIDDAARSPWIQGPVRITLFKRGEEGDSRLAPYSTPGRLHHAALTEVDKALREVRQRAQENLDKALHIMDAVAFPASFFFGGAPMAIAGCVHAALRLREMGMSVAEYQAQDSLASVALVPMQQALWEHPSSVRLAGKLLEGGFEVLSDVVQEGAAGAILGAIQVALIMQVGATAFEDWVAADESQDEAS